MKDFIGNLVLWKKFALIGGLVLAMVVAPTVLVVRNAWDALETARAEVSGLAPAREIIALIQLTQQHRGIAVADLAGVQGTKVTRVDKQAEVDQALRAVLASSAGFGSKTLSVLAENVQQDWRGVVATVEGKTVSWSENFERQSALLTKQFDLLASVVDISTLALDAESGSHYLIASAFTHLPQLTETLALARSRCMLELGGISTAPIRRMQLGALRNGVWTHRRDANKAFEKAINVNPNALSDALDKPKAAAMVAAEEAIEIVEAHFVDSESLNHDPPQYIANMTRAIDTQFELIVRVCETLEDILNARVARTRNELLTLAGLTLGMGSLALWVMILVSQSTTRSIAHALRIARTVAAGDLTSRIEVTSRDEIGQLLLALKAMNESLRVIDERFRALAGLSIDVFWEQDERYRFTQMSGDGDYFGSVSVAACIGKTRWELGYVDMDESEWQRHREQLDQRQVFKDFEVKRLDDKGRLRIYATSGAPIFDTVGNFVGYRGVARDVTERHNAEANLRALEAQLREAQKMESIGTLAGGIAHDFNNILGAILGNIALIREDLGDGHPTLASLQQINKAALRARTLVQQILAFSRKQPQKLVVQPLRPRVEEALALLRATLPAGVSLEASLVDTPLPVLADATQLQQVLMNLCTNAWHAMSDTTGHIEVGLDSVIFGSAANSPGGLDPGSYAHLWVRDDGKGMDAATSTRIFEPFYTTKPVGLGTGLGLSVVHGIVTAHHGAIAVDSTSGVGTTFHLYFPLLDKLDDDGPSGWGELQQSHGEGQHVLYIDDDEVMLVMVEQLLQRLNYRVTCYGDAQRALTAVRERPTEFDLVVTDFNMPEISGLDVARELGRVRMDLPVVISSGYVSEEMLTEARRCGVHSVVQKENTIDELGPLVERIFSEEEVVM